MFTPINQFKHNFMPVEISRIKGRLKDLFPKANLSNKRLDELSARLAKKPSDDADDAAIDEVLNNANDIYSFEEMAKDQDRIANAENKLKNQPPTVDDETKPTDPPKPESKSKDIPAWAQSLLDEVKGLKEGKITETKTQSARQLFDKNETFKSLKEKGREFYFSKIDVNSETSIEDQISSIEEVHNELVQGKADTTEHSNQPPMNSGNEKLSTDDLDKIVSNATR